MPRNFIQNGNYFEALTDIETPAGATVVTQRPSEFHTWQNDAWVDGGAPAPTTDMVNAERERRIAAGTDLTVPGLSASVALQMRDEDEFNILGLSQMAQLRISASDPTPFNFRDRENVVHSVSPSQMLSLAIAAATFKSAIIEASWVLKEMDPIPADYADDSRWP